MSNSVPYAVGEEAAAALPFRRARDLLGDSLLVVFCLIVAVVSVLLVILVRNYLVMHRKLQKIPGPYNTIPMLFVALAHNSIVKASRNGFDYSILAANAALGYIDVFMRKGWRIFKVTIGLTPFVVLYTPKGAEDLLKSNTVVNKSLIYDLLNFWLGTGLLTSPRSKWKGRRKLLTPAFHYRLLEDFVPVMSEQALVFVNQLMQHQDEKYVSVVKMTSLCTLDIICETAMGVSLNCQKNSNSEYVKAVKAVSGSFINRIAKPWLWKDVIFFLTHSGKAVRKHVDLLHETTEKIIRERKEEYVKRGDELKFTIEDIDKGLYRKRRLAFLDILLSYHLSDPTAFTERDIREEVDTFMFEGHDTTAMGLSFTMHLLGLNPDIQQKVYEEIQSVFGDDRTRPATIEEIRELKFLECVIKESLRLYPPVPIIARNVDQDIEIEGYTVPKGSTVNLSVYNLHHNPDVFDKPDEFLPERFLPENSAKRHPYAFVPFAAGPRNCIGQKFALLEEKIVLSTILRNFKLVSLDSRDKTLLVWELVLRPYKDLRVKFIPRE